MSDMPPTAVVKKKKVRKPLGPHASVFVNGLFKQNPLFFMLLGMCPALATTTSLESAFGMGLLFFLVLVCSNVLISLLRKVIPEAIRIPCYIVIIATFVTVVKLLANAFLYELYQTLGVFISLIVVNCIILGRAEAFASHNSVLDSLLDGLGMGLGYWMALLIMAFFRELIGTGGFTVGAIFPFLTGGEAKTWAPFDAVKLPIFTQPVGAFVVLASILGVIAAFKNYRGGLRRARELQERLAAIARKKAEAGLAAPKLAEREAVK